MSHSVARAVIKAAIIRLESLDLFQNNEVFTEENIPVTTKDKSFTIFWGEGLADDEITAMNNKLTINRPLVVKVFYKSQKQPKGEKLKRTLLDIYDKEEEIISSFLKTRLTTDVHLEVLETMNVAPADVGGDEWLVNTLEFTYKYQVNV